MMETVFAHIYKQALKMRQPSELGWILVYPAIGILSIGIFAIFLVSKGGLSTNPLFFVVAGAIVWDFYSLSQRGITYGLMHDVWDQCLKHGFVSKSDTFHYLVGNSLFGLLTSVAALVFVGAIAYLAFSFNLFQAGIYLAASLFSTFIFATSIGILIIALMLRKSKAYMQLVWIATGAMMVLSGVYYPVDILPAPISTLANLFPTTHAISALRGALGLSGVNVLTETTYAIVSSLTLLVVSLFIYSDSLKQAKIKGNLVY